jgi:hypothetical protein
MGRIPFRFAFPVASLALAALLMFLSRPQIASSREMDTDGEYRSPSYLISPQISTEIVKAMFLPATTVAAPVFISSAYLLQIYPSSGNQIQLFSEAVVLLAGFLQWYWIGRLLEWQLGYESEITGRVPIKWRRILNSTGIAMTAALALLGVFIAFQPGTLSPALISVVCCCFFIVGLVRLRRAQANPTPETTDLRLR